MNGSDIPTYPSILTTQKISTTRLAEVFRQIDFAPREKYGPHSHHRLEINYVRRGCCSLRLNGNIVTFKKDDLMVIPSGLTHTFEAGVRGTRLIQLEFMPELFRDIINGSGFNPAHPFHPRKLLTIRSNIRIKHLLQTIIWELQHREEGFRHIVISGYMQLLILLMRENMTDTTSASYPPILAQIVQLIDSSDPRDTDLSEIAARLNITTRYIRKLFATHIGTSPSRYILDRKMERVKEQLANTDMTLKEISSQCGFSSARHLNACFIRIMGYPPSKHLG